MIELAGRGRCAAVAIVSAAVGTLWLLAAFALLRPAIAQAAPAALPTARQDSAVTATTPLTGVVVYIVVQADGTGSLVRPITFTTPISGIQALLSTGLSVTVGDTGFGPAVCAIEGTGCPVDNCFCDPKRFGADSSWDGTQWQSYQVGASQSVISTTGAVEGWRWGEATTRPWLHRRPLPLPTRRPAPRPAGCRHRRLR